MPPKVLAAVQKAALHPVRLHDLQQKAGEYIARRLSVRGRRRDFGGLWSYQPGDGRLPAVCQQHQLVDIPQAIDGMKNQVVVLRAHRFASGMSAHKLASLYREAG